MFIDAKKNINDVLKSMKMGKVMVVTRSLSKFEFLRSVLFLLYGLWYVVWRILAGKSL